MRDHERSGRLEEVVSDLGRPARAFGTEGTLSTSRKHIVSPNAHWNAGMPCKP